MKKRILTGDRPTGPLHLGHYIGSLKNRVALQDEYEEFILIADIQALTDNFEHPEKVKENIFQVALDYLSVGIDPNKSSIVVQSQVPELAELTVYLMNLVTVARLERNPTVKDEIKQKGFAANLPVGFFVYPVSQVADILGFGAHLVPVGEDQLPMIELTREIAKRFNGLYNGELILPKPLLSSVPRLIGTDGKDKMSKSLGNVINLSETEENIKKKIMKMFTDPTRVHPTDPGHVEGNPVFIYLNAFDPDVKAVKELEERYKKGTVSDVEVKERLIGVLNNLLKPIRASRKKFEADPSLVNKILEDGTRRGRDAVSQIMREVRKSMRINIFRP